MALKIRRNNTSILDTFNDEDIQKEYDKMILPIIADTMDDAYEQYLQFKSRGICSCYKPKSKDELTDWIWEQNTKGKTTLLDVSWINVSDMTDLSYCFEGWLSFTEIKGLENWDVSNVKDMECMFYWCEKLTEIKGLDNWADKVSNCKNVEAMFDGTPKTLRRPKWVEEISLM